MADPKITVNIKVKPHVEQMIDAIYRLQEQVGTAQIPGKPKLMDQKDHDRAVTRLKELVETFDHGWTMGRVEDCADSLMQLAYCALAQLLLSGVAPGPVFDEVHRVKTEKAKVKPKDTVVDHSWLLWMDEDDVKAIKKRHLNKFIEGMTPPSIPRRVDKDAPVQGTELIHLTRKPELHLIPYEAQVAEARGFMFGKYVKYAAWDWTQGYSYSDRIDSCHHHIAAWFEGQKFDPQSGVHHLGLARCNLAMLIGFEALGLTHVDDRRPIKTVTYEEHKSE